MRNTGNCSLKDRIEMTGLPKFSVTYCTRAGLTGLGIGALWFGRATLPYPVIYKWVAHWATARRVNETPREIAYRSSNYAFRK